MEQDYGYIWELCYEKPHKVNAIVSPTVFDTKALNLIISITFVEMILV